MQLLVSKKNSVPFYSQSKSAVSQIKQEVTVLSVSDFNANDSLAKYGKITQILFR